MSARTAPLPGGLPEAPGSGGTAPEALLLEQEVELLLLEAELEALAAQLAAGPPGEGSGMSAAVSPGAGAGRWPARHRRGGGRAQRSAPGQDEWARERSPPGPRGPLPP